MTKKNEEHTLGYIRLELGSKLVIPMSDIFLHYTFQNEEFWEDLRKIVNIIYEAYNEVCGDTKINLLVGKIIVATQFADFKDFKSSTPKTRDILIEGDDEIHHTEFQNDTSPEPPVETRSTEYFGFSLSRGVDKRRMSMWLLNGTVPELLKGEVFSNCVLMDEHRCHRHPIGSNILYVDLKKLAEQDTKAGELASVLIGAVSNPKNSEVIEILDSLRRSFEKFKIDKEVRNIMSREEQLRAEGKAELLPLLEEKDRRLVEKDRRIAELEALLTGGAVPQH